MVASLFLLPAQIDACILQYASARRFCFGADCRSCIKVLDDIAHKCVDGGPKSAGFPACGVQASPRGAHFLAQLRNYRYGNVGTQCLRSVPTIKPFDVISDMTCGAAVWKPDDGPHLSLDAMSIGCYAYLVTENPMACEAACDAHHKCAGFVRVEAGLPYSGGPSSAKTGVGACYFRSDVSATRDAPSGTSCYIKPVPLPKVTAFWH